MKIVLILVIIFLVLMFGTLEIYRWYRKGYEEGLADGYKAGYNNAVKEAMEKLK